MSTYFGSNNLKVNVVKVNSGSGGVSSWNDLTDKPFGETVTYGDTLKWDGNTEGLVSIDVGGGLVYYISDAVPTIEDCVNGVAYTYNDGNEYSMPYEQIKQIYDSVGVLLLTDGVIVAPADNASIDVTGSGNFVTFPKAGIYHADFGTGTYVTSLTIPGYKGFETKDITKIPVEYLPEGYPYTEEGSGAVETVILEETTLTGSEEDPGELIIPSVLPFVAGNTYEVIWNGTEYTCVATEADFTAEGMGIITGIGNGASMGLPDNGEPFLIAAIPAYGMTLAASYEGLTSVTVKITETGSGKREIIHKLDNKFIDAEWMASTRTEKLTFIPETTVVYENETDTATTLEVENIPKEILKSGVKTYVTFEGNQYEVNTFSAYDETVGMGVCLIGNWSLGGYEVGITPPDVPFGICINIENGNGESPIYVWRSGDGSTTTATIKVEFDGTVYNEIPESFLPDKALKKYYQFPVDLEDCYHENSSTFTSEADAAMKKAAKALAEGLLVIGNYEGIPCIFESVGYYPGDGMYSMTFAPLSEKIMFDNSPTPRRYTGKKELILASSTEGSTKQFRITVDDSGNLTATEV